MCWMMIGMGVASVAGQLMGNRKQDKEMGEQIARLNAQKKEKVRELNYNVASLSTEQQAQFDSAVQTLQNNSINSMRSQGMIEAALGETNLEGRTMDTVMREVRGQDARVQDSVRQQYAASWTGLQNRKETAIMETQSSLDGMPTIKGPSAFARTLGVVNAGVSGVMGGMTGGAGAWGGVLDQLSYGATGQKSSGGFGGMASMLGGLMGGGKTGANMG